MAGMSTVVDHAWPLPRLTDEPARLAALHQLDALDQPRRADLDVLVRLAAYVCGTPTAVINLIDRDRQWPAAAHGCEPKQVPRADSMCSTSILSVDVSYTPDARRDARWQANPHVTGELGDIRLYAAAPLTLAGGEIVGTICAFSNQTDELSRLQLERLRDVAEQAVRMLELRKASDQLGYAATRDALTGLPNRTLFEEALRLGLAKQRRGGAQPAVLFLDLDGFKAINDTYGHAIGDDLLRAVSDRLLATVRATDLLARLAGDELVVLCEVGPDGAQGVRRLQQRLRDCFAAPFELSCGALELGASMGVAFADGETVRELITRADEAMYIDKYARKVAAGAVAPR